MLAYQRRALMREVSRFAAVAALVLMGSAWFMWLGHLFPPIKTTEVTGDNALFLFILCLPAFIPFAVAISIIVDRDW